jgi:quercetin dioxygenase-like cupin family protein
VKTSNEQTKGRMLVLLGREPRGSTPLHSHGDADECIYVVDGELTFVTEDGRFDVGPGGFIFAPQGVTHAFVVRSESAEIVVTLSPAGVEGPEGAGLNGLFREMGTPVKGDEPSPGANPPEPDEFAKITAAYDMYIKGPPPPIDT